MNSLPRQVWMLVAFFAIVGVFVFFNSGGAGLVKPPAAPTPEATAVPTPVGPRTVNLLVTGDKVPFLEDSETKRILLEQHNFVVTYTTVTSLQMADRMIGQNVAGYDGMWSSNDIQLEKLRQIDEAAKSDPSIGKRTTFLTYHPSTYSTILVIYAWDKSTDALVKAGLVEKNGTTYFAKDLQPILNMTLQNVLWPSLGVTNSAGEVRINSSDPLQGDSGMMWAGLVTVVQLKAHGKVQQTAETINPVLSEVDQVIGSDKFLQPDDQVLFERFFSSAGSSQMIVGYESQLYDFVNTHQQDREEIQKRLRIIYAPQSVWAFNPFMSLSRNGSDFANLLENNGPRASQDLREVACQRHAYRTYTTCAQKHPEVFDAWGMPVDLPSPIGVPSVNNLDLVLNSMKSAH